MTTGAPIEVAFRRVGRRALLVEVDDVEAASAVHQWILAAADLPPVRDLVPAARSVLLDGVDPEAWQDVLSHGRIVRGVPAAGDEVLVEVRYDGADLDLVAEAWSCSVDDVVRLLTGTEFVVAFCGFAPGFAYCTARTNLPTVARRAEPRARVPAGSVALAGEFCGLYPNEMPGGWQLIGRTDATLFDPNRSDPALLKPGDRVRFEAV